jgi:hypothetical protein
MLAGLNALAFRIKRSPHHINYVGD